ncbi:MULTISPECIES: hypothetical protein [unclassified Knoellia]|uniref:hypothetical protein n=1 Tax=Knoellia altitudinis TaxID=3404795 RepID=UPI00360E3C2A
MSERDIDAEFDAIVSRWDDDSPQPPKPRTVQDITTAYAALSRPETAPPEPVDESTEDVAPVDPDAEGALTRREPEARPEVAAEPPLAWREGPSIDAEDDDHFEPAPVQLPPGEDIGYWGAIVGLVGGPLLMVWIALASPFYRGWWILGSIVLFLGGFALLVMRSPRLRDPRDDDGARV